MHVFLGPNEAARRETELTWYFRKSDGSFDSDAATIAHRRLTVALERAEAEGRVAWRRPNEHNTFEQLNELLTRNNLAPLQPSGPRFWDYRDYTYHGVEALAKQIGLAITVVW